MLDFCSRSPLLSLVPSDTPQFGFLGASERASLLSHPAAEVRTALLEALPLVPHSVPPLVLAHLEGETVDNATLRLGLLAAQDLRTLSLPELEQLLPLLAGARRHPSAPVRAAALRAHSAALDTHLSLAAHTEGLETVQAEWLLDLEAEAAPEAPLEARLAAARAFGPLPPSSPRPPSDPAASSRAVLAHPACRAAKFSLVFRLLQDDSASVRIVAARSVPPLLNRAASPWVPPRALAECYAALEQEVPTAPLFQVLLAQFRPPSLPLPLVALEEAEEAAPSSSAFQGDRANMYSDPPHAARGAARVLQVWLQRAPELRPHLDQAEAAAGLHLEEALRQVPPH